MRAQVSKLAWINRAAHQISYRYLYKDDEERRLRSESWSEILQTYNHYNLP